MSATETAGTASGDPELLRTEWLDRLSSLMTLVGAWAEELDWSSRQIEKRMKDARLGSYGAPALIMQKGTTRVLLDPIARFAPGTDGVVDLYLMPAYDDIASLFFIDGGWRLQHMLPAVPTAATTRKIKPRPLSKEVLTQVLDEMIAHAS